MIYEQIELNFYHGKIIKKKNYNKGEYTVSENNFILVIVTLGFSRFEKK